MSYYCPIYRYAITYDTYLVYGAHWVATRFNTGSESITTSVLGVFLSRSGSPTGNITVSICTVDVNGDPVFPAMASGEQDVTELMSSISNFNEEIFYFNVSLSAGTEYCIVISFPNGDGDNFVRWAYGYAPSYTWIVGSQGSSFQNLLSTDSGASWDTSGTSATNVHFRIWDERDFEVELTPVLTSATKDSATIGITLDSVYGLMQFGFYVAFRVYLEYGLTASYGSEEYYKIIRTDDVPGSDSEVIDSLTPYTKYYYRFRAVYGKDSWYEDTFYSSGSTFYTHTGNRYPNNETGRVGSLIHRRDVEANVYSLEITFGGISYQPPSTVPAIGSGASGYGGITEPTMVDLGLPPLLPEPPRRTLRDIAPTPFIELQGATQYARARAQELLELGFIDEKGVPTPKGREWARTHPTEEAPRKYTAKTGHLQDRMEYLRAEMLAFQRRTGKAPRVQGAEAIMRGEWAYTPVSAARWQVDRMGEQIAALRTREQILADLAAGKRTTTGRITTQHSPAAFQRRLARLKRNLAESRSNLGRQSIQRAINKLIQEQR